MVSTTIGRRHFLMGSLALTTVGAAGIGFASASGAVDVQTRTAWVLNTEHWTSPRGHPTRTHCKCSACVSHGQNKIFATLDAANDPSLRAHPGCLCEPAEILLSLDVWQRLFGDASSVDRRNPAVDDILNGRSDPGRPTTPSDPPATRPVITPRGRGGGSGTGPVPNAGPSSHPSVVPRVHRRGAHSSVIGIAGGSGGTPADRPRLGPFGAAMGLAGGPDAGGVPPSASLKSTPDRSVTEPWDWFALPVAGVVTGLGFLIWWRRRGEEDEDVVVDPRA